MRKELTCTQCGTRFVGYHTCQFCLACAADRKLAVDKRRRLQGANRPLGSIDKCAVCGKDYVVNSGMQKYCTDCASAAYRTRRNLNVCVIGGPGTGKSRGYVIPNALQAGCNFIVTDPKGELLRTTGSMLTAMGYSVRCLDLQHPETSFGYNPFAYIQSDLEAVALVGNLQRSIKPKGSTNSDPFWDEAACGLLSALVLYVWHEMPKQEQNWAMVLRLLNLHKPGEGYSPITAMFAALEQRDPDAYALTQWNIYRQAGDDRTAQSISVTAAVALAKLAEPTVAAMMRTDELYLEDLATEKVALFVCTDDADPTLNFLAGMLYTQLFQRLNHLADRVHKGRLPKLVQFYLDEFANITLPLDFEHFLATCRGRNMGVSIILQSLSQLKRL